MELGLHEGVPVPVEETVDTAVTELVTDCDPVRLLVISPVPVPVEEDVIVMVFEGVRVLVPVIVLDAVWDPVPVGVSVLVEELLPDPVCVWLDVG